MTPAGPEDGRDRDSAGRPRNARPRDGLGRPLDRASAGQPTMPDGLALEPAGALALAQRLIDSGRPFHAHEVLEAIWKSPGSADRELWRGLAQLAVGLTHARRGNQRGASALLRRGADAVGRSGRSRPDLVAPEAIARAARDLADRIDRTGLDGLGDAELRLQLAAATDTAALTWPPSATSPP